MKPDLSQCGEQMSQLTGVRAIMKDIIETLRAGSGQSFINLSAGNPVILPEVEELWRHCTLNLLNSKDFGEVVCRYGSSQGYEPLIEAVKNDFNRRYGLNLSDRQILITPGSQSIYFYGANAFGGKTINNTLKKVVLPLCPDYTGYGGVSLDIDAVISYQPKLEIDEKNHRFKYRPDFNQLIVNQDTGCIIFSRPCNPTGNVLSDQEVRKIADIALPFQVPVFVDSAYAPPFPCLNFTQMNPQFGENIIHCLSLSKAGLPGERVGIAIGNQETIEVLQAFQTNASIHSSRYGQALAAQAINSGELANISENIIRPHYQEKMAILEQTLDENMPKNTPWFLHRGEGAIFAWLWFKDLPIQDWELYQELKKVGIIVVPGSPFFPGLREDWPHKNQCIRISLTATIDEIVNAMKALAKVYIEVI
jgi:valine--pyruvate aminotransferase